MKIAAETFKGIAPRYQANLLPEGYGQDARNCKITSGGLVPYNNPLTVRTDLGVNTKTIFLQPDGQWRTWDSLVNAVPGAVLGDELNRYYYTGDGVPKVYPGDNDLGVPTPTTAPTVAADALSVFNEATVYTKNQVVTLEDSYVATVTLTGAIVVADIFTITLDGTDFTVTATTYTLTLDVMAQALANLITATSGNAYVATANGAVITITKPVYVGTFTVTTTVSDSNTAATVVKEAVKVFQCIVDSTTAGSFQTADWNELTVLDQVTRAYVYIFVSSLGEMGPPSPASSTVDVYPGQGVTLSGLEAQPAGNYSLSKHYIYRTNTGSNATEYQFLDETAINTATYYDTKLDADLGEVMQSLEWIAPPSDLEGLVLMANGIMAGFVGKDVYLSVAYQPHAWPLSQRSAVDYDIVALGVFGNSLLVTTKGQPYLITGTDPAAMTPQIIDNFHSNLCKTGLVNMGEYVMYPAETGLIGIGVGLPPTVMTEGIMTKDEWKSFKPATLRGYAYSDKYVGFYDRDDGSVGSFIYSGKNNDLMPLDVDADAGYYDPETGDLYLAKSGILSRFDDGATKMTQFWKSPDYVTLHPVNMGVGQVFAATYPVTFEIYGDGNLLFSTSIQNSKQFRLRGGYKANVHSIKVSGNNTINRFYCAPTPEELR